MLDWTEAVTRAEFSRIPDGEYSFVDYLDDDLAGSPVRLAATVRVAGDEVVVDYAGTDPQVSGALNLPGFGERHPFLAQGLINLVLTRNPSIPLTGGIMRAIRTTAPPGSVVNPHFPAAVGTRYATVIRLYNVVLGALAQALPDAIPSAGCGAAAVVSVSIPELHRGGTKVSVLEPLEGGGGAGEGFDGVSGNDSAAGYLRNTPVESIESAVAVRVLRYELSADSAGAGRFRGGWGTVFTFQLLRPDSVVTARGMERCRFQPWGLHGGEAAERTRTFLNPGSPAGRDIGRIDVLQPEPGDVVSVHSSGGGGYGNPLERDLDLIAADLDAELLSAEAAQQRYGVVFGADGIDARATAGRRAEMQHARPGVRIGDVDFGEARREYEAVWDAPASAALCALLYRLPVALRSYAKRRIHQVVESEPTTVAVADRLDGVWARIQTSLEERAVTIGLDTAGNEP
jgi:N-methylhydantoinase B